VGNASACPPSNTRLSTVGTALRAFAPYAPVRCGLICSRASANPVHPCDKSARRANHLKPVQPSRKNISLNLEAKSATYLRPSHPMRGALANVTNARWDAVDARAATDVWLERTAKSCGPDVAVLALSPREAKLLGGDGGKRAVRRGEHEVSRKATAQGRPGCSACTCMLVCASSVRNCTRDRGCSVHPVFPAPSILGRDNGRCKTRAKDVARRKGRINSSLHTVYLAQPLLQNQFNAPLQKRGKVVEQSGVRKMSPFKMQMTGQLSDYFFVTRSD
jgi:hypothetical protein